MKGKSTFATWYCKQCNRPHQVTAYNKKSNDKIIKEKKMYCRVCIHVETGKPGTHVMHKRKDTKKGSNK